MLKDFQHLFRRSFDAFREQLERRDPEDEVAELLTAMRRELVAARAALPEFEMAVLRTRHELATEREAAEQCERRGEMARRIGDEETVAVARTFAGRHRDNALLLERKLSVAEAEFAVRTREADEMKRRYQEADANRFVLVADLRRTQAGRPPHGGPTDDLLSRFEELAERIERDAARTDALDEILSEEARPAEGGDPSAVEERLREWKRGMGS